MGIFDWLFGKKETSSEPEKEEVIKSYHDNGKIKSELRKLISELDGDLENTSYEGSPYNGIGYDLHKNGELFIEGKYKNGKQEGEWKTYYDNGQLDIIGQYKNGKMNGKFKFYYKDGVLSRETDYIYGKEDGLSIQWYHSGVKYYEQKWWLGKMISEKYWDENGNEINPEKINEINNRHEERKKNEKKSEKEIIEEYEKLTGKKVAVQDYQIEYEKMASDFDQLMSEHRSWHEIIVQRSDTMKDLAQILHQSLEETTAEWTQSHFEEYKSKGEDIKEAKEGIILRLEAYGHIYTCNQDFLKKVKSFISKYADRDVKYIEGFMESTIKWDIASAQASLMGSILFAQSLGMEDVEIMKYASVESFPENVTGKTHE